MYAALPMYDRIEVRATTDALWRGIRDGLRAQGLFAPDALDRESDMEMAWLRPDLLLSQTCGLPYVRRLRGKVQLVGAVDLGLDGIAPGDYCSRIVVRSGDLAAHRQLADYRGKCCAVNAPASQSGAGTLRHLVLPLLKSGRFFGQTRMTGSHFASITAVAERRADIAAVDAGTWRLALRYLPAAQELAVLTSSAPTPGLPLITRLGGPAEALFRAVGGALAGLTPEQRDAIGIHGIVPRAAEDFAVIAEWDRQAADAGYRELDAETG